MSLLIDIVSINIVNITGTCCTFQIFVGTTAQDSSNVNLYLCIFQTITGNLYLLYFRQLQVVLLCSQHY